MSPDLERFKGVLAAIATTRPGLPIEDALAVAADVERQMAEAEGAKALDTIGDERLTAPNDSTPVEIAAAWCRKQPTVVDFMPHKKINAIKEARGLSHMGLKSAKEAIEYMQAHLLP